MHQNELAKSITCKQPEKLTINVTDEFVKPTVIIAEDQQPLGGSKMDVAICLTAWTVGNNTYLPNGYA
jgi:hypothetical protein